MLPKRIVAIGTSSLFGRVDPQGGGYIGRLKTWHEQQALHNAVFNLGISGETTMQLVGRFQMEILPRRPDLIIFNSGTNDTRHQGSATAKSNVELSATLEHLQLIIEISKNIAPLVFVSNYPIDESKTQPLIDTNYFYLQDDISELANLTKKLCNKNNLPYLNIFDEWLIENYKQYLHEDGLHANSLGHQKIFEELRKLLTSLF